MALALHCPQCGSASSDLNVSCVVCGAGLPASSEAGDGPDPREGARLGRFRLVKRLGAGGMGVVYEALDGEEPVALKWIAPDLAEREDIQARFQREAEVVS